MGNRQNKILFGRNLMCVPPVIHVSPPPPAGIWNFNNVNMAFVEEFRYGTI